MLAGVRCEADAGCVVPCRLCVKVRASDAVRKARGRDVIPPKSRPSRELNDTLSVANLALVDADC